MTVLGLLLLAISLGGVAIGFYMAADWKTRDGGWHFAVWWIPGLAAASGILMRDVVTFTVGILCFLVAGVVFVLEGNRTRKPPAGRKVDLTGGPDRPRLLDAERPTKENRTRDSRRAAS